MLTFGERLTEERKKKQLTQATLAKLLNIGQSTIAMYEINKRSPDQKTLKNFAKFFNVTIDYLLGHTDSSFTPSWWHQDSSPTDVELEEFLKNSNIHFDGTSLNEEDKEDILTYLKVKWEREKKRREKEGIKTKTKES